MTFHIIIQLVLLIAVLLDMGFAVYHSRLNKKLRQQIAGSIITHVAVLMGQERAAFIKDFHEALEQRLKPKNPPTSASDIALINAVERVFKVCEDKPSPNYEETLREKLPVHLL